jgi:hypothetical protein
MLSLTKKCRYIYPLDDRDLGRRRNIETEDAPVMFGVGNAAGIAPERFSTLFDVNTMMTAMKRE